MNLRKEILGVPNLDPFTLALAWSYVFRLINLGVLRKDNRKSFAVVSLVLAYKVNEEPSKSGIKKFLKDIEDWGFNVKEIFKKEIKVLSYLDFSMQADPKELKETLNELKQPFEEKYFYC